MRRSRGPPSWRIDFDANQSYLMAANDGQHDLIKGSLFGNEPQALVITTPTGGSATSQIFTLANVPFTTLEVIDIDASAQIATIRLRHLAGWSVPTAGPAILFGGVAAGGDGLVLIGGKLIRDPATFAAHPDPGVDRRVRKQPRGDHDVALARSSSSAMRSHR